MFGKRGFGGRRGGTIGGYGRRGGYDAVGLHREG